MVTRDYKRMWHRLVSDLTQAPVKNLAVTTRMVEIEAEEDAMHDFRQETRALLKQMLENIARLPSYSTLQPSEIPTSLVDHVIMEELEELMEQG
jgi:hypothetical protein